MRVEAEEERVVSNRVAVKIGDGAHVAAQHHAQTFNPLGFPLLVRHLNAATIQPHDVFDFAAANLPPAEKIRSRENRMLLSKPNQLRDKFEELLLVFVS